MANMTEKNSERSDSVRINISGTHFEMSLGSLLNHKNTLLGRIACNLKNNPTQSENNNGDLCFYRSADAFKEILCFYNTGELHLPSTICPKAFIKELEFWEIDQDLLEKCCKFKLLSYIESYDTANNFQELLISIRKQESRKRGESTLRSRIWAVIDNRENSLYAKIYLVVAIAFVLLSIINLAVSTVPSFKKKLTACQLMDYMMSKYDFIDEDVAEYLNSIHCSDLAYDEWLEDYEEHLDKSGLGSQGNGTDNNYNYEDYTFKFSQISLPKIETRILICEYIEFLTVGFFTIELLLRLICCPDKLAYFKSVLNCIDLVALISTYIHIIISYVFVHLKYDSIFVKILLNIQAFRSLRIMRVVQNVGVIMVLLHSMKSSIKELVILLIYMLIVVNLFANFLYLAESEETITSIPKAWYWGIVTMTTLGYGDLYPKTTQGRFIACVCAVSGIILIALVIPVVVNNFMTLYEVASLSDRIVTKKEASRKSEQELFEKKSFPKGKVQPLDQINVEKIRF